MKSVSFKVGQMPCKLGHKKMGNSVQISILCGKKTVLSETFHSESSAQAWGECMQKEMQRLEKKYSGQKLAPAILLKHLDNQLQLRHAEFLKQNNHELKTHPAQTSKPAGNNNSPKPMHHQPTRRAA